MHARWTSWTHNPDDPYRAQTADKYDSQRAFQWLYARDRYAGQRAESLRHQAPAPDATRHALLGAVDQSSWCNYESQPLWKPSSRIIRGTTLRSSIETG